MTQMGLNYLNYVENNRHNVATETQSFNELLETQRANKARENLTKYSNKSGRMQARASLKQAKASLQNAKTNKYNAKTNRYVAKTGRKQYHENVRHDKATEDLEKLYKTGMLRLGDRELAEKHRSNVRNEQLKQQGYQTQKDIATQGNKTKKSIAKKGRQLERGKLAVENVHRTADRTAKKQMNKDTLANQQKLKSDELGYKYLDSGVRAGLHLFDKMFDMFDLGDKVKDSIS